MIARFWIAVISEMERTLNRASLVNVKVCLVGVYACPRAQSEDTKFLDLATVLARKAIEMHWHSTDCLPHNRWKRDVERWAIAKSTALRD